MEKKKIVIVGGGVAGICAATKLVDNGYPGELITVIDMGKDPYKRLPEEIMRYVGLIKADKISIPPLIPGDAFNSISKIR
jgi:NADH dehydrogenase FAD-containing subunit